MQTNMNENKIKHLIVKIVIVQILVFFTSLNRDSQQLL